MSLFNQFTYPSGLPTTVDVQLGDITVSGDGVNKDFQVFELQDNIENFQTVPKKSIADPNNATKYAYCIPFVENNEKFDGAAFERRLYLNNTEIFDQNNVSLKRHVPINRPLKADGITYKKAYLHSVTYAAYDYNDMLPYYDESNYGALTLSQLKVPNVFGTNKGLMLAINQNVNDDIVANYYIPTSNVYTTAHFPYYLRNLQLREREIRAMEILGQGALRSSVRWGMLPSDVFKNNFRLKLGSINSSTPTETELPNTILWDTKLNNSSSKLNDSNLDTMLPAYTNEIDILIPDTTNSITVDVTGAGWNHGIDWKQIPTNVKCLAQIVPHLITWVQMPIKVSLAIRFD